ncbi:MAG TPA: molybdenum cofactor biosynthesis protein MoaE [Sulfuricaulis sp.]|nr:molybdenum cofactor biosynthesis protein MoaE [Sulfuricaulis sp.]
MTVQLRDVDFDPCEELAAYQQGVPGQRGKYGAVVSFVGTMRDFNDGRAVQAMTLEHYPGMTEKNLQRICTEARRQWDILDALIVHRVGEVRPNDPIVLVAVWSAHRAAAFDACRYLIEALKTHAPFWKKEQGRETTRWVEHNNPVS